MAFDHVGFDTAVCVMDASGVLGSALVRALLQRGYTVHAALQNYHGNSEGFHGISYEEKKRLKIFESDPFDYHSIVEALKGCSGLFYSFEPPQDQPTYDNYMAEVEVRAAHNVLEACAQTHTIDKVVFTSSATAVIWRDDCVSMSTIDERHWSDTNLCAKYKLWHAMSKTLAEKTAWALAMDRGVNMVSINGGLLLSNDLTIKTPYLKGAAEMYEDGVFVTVDLDYLVEAHIRVFEDVSSYGRYLCFNRVINCNEASVKLSKMLAPVPSQAHRCNEDTKMIEQRISNKKLNELMIDFEGGSDLLIRYYKLRNCPSHHQSVHILEGALYMLYISFHFGNRMILVNHKFNSKHFSAKFY